MTPAANDYPVTSQLPLWSSSRPGSVHRDRGNKQYMAIAGPETIDPVSMPNGEMAPDQVSEFTT